MTAAADQLFGEAATGGRTLALLVVHRGCIAIERYDAKVTAEQTRKSWSVAKSVLHALVGIAVRDLGWQLDAPASVPTWRDSADPRSSITLRHLLQMTDGLDFVETYTPGQHCDVIEMLRHAKDVDTAAYAEARQLLHPPGTQFNYSSGTSMIVAALLRRALGGRDATQRFMQAHLFGPLGMASPQPRFDRAGTFLGSSYLFASPRDFARFGLLYLRDGCWQDQRVLPEGWVDFARTPTAASDGTYGAHWWLDIGEPGTFCAKGLEGQYILLSPQRDALVVRLGVSTEQQREHVVDLLGQILREIPAAHPPGN